MRAMEMARREVPPDRFCEIKYETFCERPLESLQRVVEFAQLSPSAEFERQVAAAPIRNMSNRWREDLTVAQQRLLEELLREDLQRCGYAVAPAA
jgi:hypothetical protein